MATITGNNQKWTLEWLPLLTVTSDVGCIIVDFHTQNELITNFAIDSTKLSQFLVVFPLPCTYQVTAK